MGVLDEMTKGITERKAAVAGPKLTPVGTEASPTKPSIPEVAEVFLTNEAVADVAKDLRAKAALLIEVANGLDKLTSMGTEAQPDVKVEAAAAKKAAEVEGDKKAKARAVTTPETEAIIERLAAVKSKAQAEVFTAADAETEEPEAPTPAVPDGWTCPTHGAKNLKQLESRKGRKYMACQTAGCGQFEKE